MVIQNISCSLAGANLPWLSSADAASTQASNISASIITNNTAVSGARHVAVDAAAVAKLGCLLREAVVHISARAQALLEFAYGEAHSSCEVCQFSPFFTEMPYNMAADIVQEASAAMHSTYRILHPLYGA